MSVARSVIKNPKLVPGGGATELTVSPTLKQKSQSIEGIEKVDIFVFTCIIDSSCSLVIVGCKLLKLISMNFFEAMWS